MSGASVYIRACTRRAGVVFRPLGVGDPSLRLRMTTSHFALFFQGGFVVTGLAIWWWYERHTRVCPITGRKQFVFLTEQHVHRLAAVVRNGMLRSCQGRLLPRYDPRTIRVDCIARHVIRSNAGVPELTRTRWNVHVVDNEDVANAIVLPASSDFKLLARLK